MKTQPFGTHPRERLFWLLLTGIFTICWLPQPKALAEPEGGGNRYQVERTKTVSIPVNGTPRILVLNPGAVGIESETDTEVVFSGLLKGTSVVHLWDGDGRRTLVIEVIELESLLQEFEERKQENLRRQLGISERTLKFKYDTFQEHLERGRAPTFSKTDEDHRIRAHDASFSVGVPWGRLEGDAYLERRRDIDSTGKEVIQPRNLSLRLENVKTPFFGPTDFVVGDRDVTLSRLSITGTRFRGGGIFPTELPAEALESQKGKWKYTLFGGEEREGSLLDLPAGTQSRQARSSLMGTKLEYYPFDFAKLFLVGGKRFGKLEDGRSDHVVSGGLDGWLTKQWYVRGEMARNGTQGAQEFETRYIPNESFRMFHNYWRFSKGYKSVIGSVGREGQTGYEMNADWVLPKLNESVVLSGAYSIMRDRTSVNPNNPTEWNTSYGANISATLPWEIGLQLGYAYSDQSASPVPSVSERANVGLQKEIRLDKKWFRSLVFTTSAARSEFSKSNNVPGFDASLQLFQAGVRANLGLGLWGGVRWGQGELHESNPEELPKNISPRQLTYEMGWSHTMTNMPLSLNFSFRFEDVVDTFSRTHQPFPDRDQISGSFGLSWNFKEDQELFAQLTVTHQDPETSVGEADVNVFFKTGMRTEWDTAFTIQRSSRVSGIVFLDANANRKFDPDETLLKDVKVYVVDGDEDRTDKEGAYSVKVKEGNQTIKCDWENIPKGYYFSTPNTVRRLFKGGEKIEINFGVTTEVEVKGIVYNDINENMEYEDGYDMPLPKIGFRTGTGQSAKSGFTGHYSIRRVPAGKGTVSLDLRSLRDGYRTLVPIRQKWEAKAGERVVFNMPMKALRSIIGFTYEDDTNNGRFETFESVYGGLRILLEKEGEVVAEQITTETGRYTFGDLKPGTYVVRLDLESVPKGFNATGESSYEVEVWNRPFVGENYDFGVRDPNKKVLGDEDDKPKPKTPLGWVEYFFGAESLEEHIQEITDAVETYFGQESRMLSDDWYQHVADWEKQRAEVKP